MHPESPIKNTVIYHRADFDGLFCREIARKFLPPDTEFIGWDYGDAQIPMPPEGQVYLLDLSPDCLCDHPGLTGTIWNRLIWIDHHKSAIEKFPAHLKGYRIDGVAACRLAWQWFNTDHTDHDLVQKAAYIDRTVTEPWAVRLAGEYDVWDKRDPAAETFQFGLRSGELDWPSLLRPSTAQHEGDMSAASACRYVEFLLAKGESLQYYQRRTDASIIAAQAFTVQWEGYTWLCLNTPRCNSLSFTAGLRPEHDGCLGFNWNGLHWRVSLYGVPGKPDLDFSPLAIKHGGGGHRQACGFRTSCLPFVPKDATCAPAR